MKKLTLIIASCLFMAYTANAETNAYSKNQDKKITFGVRAGVNISGITGTKNYTGIWDSQKNKMKGGISLGGIVDFKVHQYIAVQTGLYYSMQGGKTKYESIGVGFTDTDKNTTTLHYLKVPLLASFRYDFNTKLPVQLQVSTGPYMAVAIGGKYKDKYTFDGGSGEIKGKVFGYDVQTDAEGDQIDLSSHSNRGDIGWIVDAGVVLAKHYYIGMSYSAGFINISNNTPVEINGMWAKPDKNKNSVLSISVGYNF